MHINNIIKENTMLCSTDEKFDLSVLVVDDSVVSRKQLTDIVSSMFSRDTDIAKDGLDALNLMKNKNYDLLITDINMPVMNGIELIKNIRAQGSDIPIFVVSGESDKEYFIDLINEDISSFIAKPFVPDVVKNYLYKTCLAISDQKLIASYQEKLEERNIELSSLHKKLSLTNQLLNLKNESRAALMNQSCEFSGSCSDYHALAK